MGYEHEESKLCELGSKLIIAYSGDFVKCFPEKDSDLTGYILTSYGKLFYRKKADQDWLQKETPSVYLFLDWDCGTFKVDTCEKKIKKVKPEGLILNCTDRKIYEAQCGHWVKVCDLSDSIAITQTQQVECAELSLSFPLLEGLQQAKYLAKLSDADSFANVSIQNGQVNVIFADQNTPQVGQSAVLVYKGLLAKEKLDWKTKCKSIKGKKIIISVIIKRVNSTRLSVYGGLIGERAEAEGDDLTAIQNAGLQFAPTNPSLATVEQWVGPSNPTSVLDPNGRYMVPPGSLNSDGEYTVPCDGDYDIDVTLSYFNQNPPSTPQNSAPYFLLWVEPANNAAPAVAAAAPIGYTGSDLLQLGQAVITTGLSLNAGDVLTIKYLDQDAQARAYTLASTDLEVGGHNVATNWTIKAVGPQSGNPIS